MRLTFTNGLITSLKGFDMKERKLMPKRFNSKNLYLNCIQCKRNIYNKPCRYRFLGLCKGTNFFIQKRFNKPTKDNSKQRAAQQRNWQKMRLMGAISFCEQRFDKDKSLSKREQKLLLEAKQILLKIKAEWKGVL